MKKFISSILALALVLTLMPVLPVEAANSSEWVFTQSTQQVFTAPQDGIYEITTSGGAGGNYESYIGSAGSTVTLDYTLKAGDKIYINNGQQGSSYTAGSAESGYQGGTGSLKGAGGGGASSIYAQQGTSTKQLIAVAGGGGGASHTGNGKPYTSSKTISETKGQTGGAAGGGGYKGGQAGTYTVHIHDGCSEPIYEYNTTGTMYEKIVNLGTHNGYGYSYLGSDDIVRPQNSSVHANIVATLQTGYGTPADKEYSTMWFQVGDSNAYLSTADNKNVNIHINKSAGGNGGNNYIRFNNWQEIANYAGPYEDKDSYIKYTNDAPDEHNRLIVLVFDKDTNQKIFDYNIQSDDYKTWYSEPYQCYVSASTSTSKQTDSYLSYNTEHFYGAYWKHHQHSWIRSTDDAWTGHGMTSVLEGDLRFTVPDSTNGIYLQIYAEVDHVNNSSEPAVHFGVTLQRITTWRERALCEYDTVPGNDEAVISAEPGYAGSSWVKDNKGAIVTENNPGPGKTTIKLKGYWVSYNNNGGSGAIETDYVEVNKNYTLSDGAAFTKEGFKLDGWSLTAGNASTIKYNLQQVVKDVTEPGKTLQLYAHWKPLWKLTIDYAKPSKSTNPMIGQAGTLYKWYETNVDKISKHITLPSPKIRGWTFLGYKIDGTDVTSDTLWSWNANKTAIGQWKENKYNVRYNDGAGNSKTDKNILYEDSRNVWTNVETQFTKTGYYLDGWATKQGATVPVYKIPLDSKIDSTRTTTDSFKKLCEEDGGTFDLWAVWKPTPYVIRIYDNYNGQTNTCSDKSMHNTCSFHKDYLVYYDAPFTFPEALWSHQNAVAIGYDINANVYATPTHKVKSTVKNLTTAPMEVKEFFTIWDNVPTIKSPVECNFTYGVAQQWGINVNNNTVSASDLEDWLLDRIFQEPGCYVRDYEWTKRAEAGDGRPSEISKGNNYGYSVRIESLSPNYISEAAANERPVSYTVTYVVTDDVGNSATSSTKLFLGDSIDILIMSY